MEKLQAVLGILVFLLIALMFSENKKKALAWKLIVTCISLQLFIAFILQGSSWLQSILLGLNKGVLLIDAATQKGSSFMFGYLAGGDVPFVIQEGKSSFIIAFSVLPIVMVVSALSRVLFHWGILQKIIHGLSLSIEKILKIDALSCFAVASSFFFGIIETPLLLRHYLLKMSRAQLFIMFTACMSTISGTVMVLYANVLQNIVDNPTGHIITASLMSLPAAIMFALIMVPYEETEEKENPDIKIEITTNSTLEALVEGCIEGIHMVFYIVAVIVTFFACIHIINSGLSVLSIVGIKTSLEHILAAVFYPLCWLMGIPWSECWQAALLMANKLLLNEFVAFTQMASLSANSLSQTSYVILTYALCGFANMGSLGILTAGLAQIFADQKHKVLSLAPKSIVAGTLSTMTTGAVIAIFL